MRFSTLGYSIKQGVKNIWRNKMFSLASIATMGACIFLFGIFFAVVINFNYIVKNAETDVSMTVFFNEDVDQATIDEIGTEIKAKTDAQGQFSITWPAAGMYWVDADVKDDKTSVPQAKERRLSYVGTFEVLP